VDWRTKECSAERYLWLEAGARCRPLRWSSPEPPLPLTAGACAAVIRRGNACRIVAPLHYQESVSGDLLPL